MDRENDLLEQSVNTRKEGAQAASSAERIAKQCCPPGQNIRRRTPGKDIHIRSSCPLCRTGKYHCPKKDSRCNA